MQNENVKHADFLSFLLDNMDSPLYSNNKNSILFGWDGGVADHTHSPPLLLPDLPTFHNAVHLANVEQNRLLKVLLFHFSSSSDVVTRFNRWQVHHWCGGSWYSRVWSLNIPAAFWNSISSGSISGTSSTSSSSLISGSGSENTVCSPNTLKTLREFEPMSVVVLKTLSWIWLWVNVFQSSSQDLYVTPSGVCTTEQQSVFGDCLH